MLKQIVDVIPQELRKKYPTREDFMYSGYYQQIQNSRIYNQIQCPYCTPYMPLFHAKPVENNIIENDANTLENLNFDFFNINNVRGCFKINEIDNKITYVSLVNAEDIAIGAGLTVIQTRYDRPVATDSCSQLYYTQENIRWSTMNQYATEALESLKQRTDYHIFQPFIPNKIGRGSYIPTQLAVRILMRCTSKKAREFQELVFDKVVTDIENMVLNKYNLILNEKNTIIKDMQDKLDYHRNFHNTSQLFSTTEIAKDFGISAQMLNIILHNLKIIYRVNNTWQVYYNLANYGLVENKQINDEGHETKGLYWTNLGREFIYEQLKRNGIEIGKNNDEAIDQLLIGEDE